MGRGIGWLLSVAVALSIHNRMRYLIMADQLVRFRKNGIASTINLQRSGAHAKPYQVKQVRVIILEDKLGSK